MFANLSLDFHQLEYWRTYSNHPVKIAGYKHVTSIKYYTSKPRVATIVLKKYGMRVPSY